MLRSRADWFAYAVLCAALTACGSSEPEGSGSSHAADSGKDSDSDAGPSDSTGSTKPGSNNKSDAGSATGSKTSGSTSSAGSGGKGGAGGSGGNQATATSDKLPDDGNQLSLCSMVQGDCNKGLACSGSASPVAESRNYCSKICESDEDCADVTPSSAKYTCSTGRGVELCEIACSGAEDTSCPSNMQCVQTGVSAEPAADGGSAGAGGNGGRGNALVPVYHCKYPLITSPLWGPCQDGEHRCDKDAICYGSAPGRPGVCTKSCAMDSDCSDKPSSGSITPSCATTSAGRGNMMETKLCVLSCLDKKDGCPDGTTCVEGPRAAMGRGGMMMGRGRGQGQDMADAGAVMESEPAYARCE
ncbi:MAG TPA: hypothetical protein VFN67_42725 [Polyangiales bacterium]|nr:hypothetical protein [Polyangiales bacterium]